MPSRPVRFVLAVASMGAAGLVGCGPSLKIDSIAVPPSVVAEVERDAPDSQDEIDEIHVVLPQADQRVRWLEDSEAILALTPRVRGGRSLVGTDIGVVGLDNDTLLVFDRDEGLLGQARVDQPSWFAVLEDDRILVSENRDLYRGTAEQALSGQWEYLGTFYDTIAWDVSGPWFVRAEPWALYLSRDGGTTFEEVFKPPTGEEIFNTEVRSDGVFVAITSDSSYASRLYVTRDQGKSFQSAALQPPNIGRQGARLQYTNEGCAWALADNAVDWVRDDRVVFDAGNWNELGQISREPVWRASAQLDTHDEPPAPRADRANVVEGAPQPCDVPFPAAAYEDETARGRCTEAGLLCMAGTAGPPAVSGRHDFGFLGDGICAGGSSCDAPQRLPTLVTWDRDTGYLDPVDLPGGCALPRRIDVARGLALLVCGDDGDEAQLFVRSSSVGWTRELTWPASPARIEWAQAADGTLVGYRACPDREGMCDIHLRSPVKVGAEGAWRAVDDDGVVALRALAGGQVLTVHEVGGESRASLRLTLGDGGFWGDRFTLLDAVDYDERIVDVTTSATGRVLLVSEREGGERQVFGVRADGTVGSPGH